MWPNHYDTDRSRQCTPSELFHCAVILTVISSFPLGSKWKTSSTEEHTIRFSSLHLHSQLDQKFPRKIGSILCKLLDHPLYDYL